MTTCTDCGLPTMRGPAAKRCATCHKLARNRGKAGRNVVVRFVTEPPQRPCVRCKMPTGRAAPARYCWACHDTARQEANDRAHAKAKAGAPKRRTWRMNMVARTGDKRRLTAALLMAMREGA